MNSKTILALSTICCSFLLITADPPKSPEKITEEATHTAVAAAPHAEARAKRVGDVTRITIEDMLGVEMSSEFATEALELTRIRYNEGTIPSTDDEFIEKMTQITGSPDIKRLIILMVESYLYKAHDKASMRDLSPKEALFLRRLVYFYISAVMQGTYSSDRADDARRIVLGTLEEKPEEKPFFLVALEFLGLI